jgi:GAF domain-containing protein
VWTAGGSAACPDLYRPGFVRATVELTAEHPSSGVSAAGRIEEPVTRELHGSQDLPLGDELAMLFARMSGLLLSHETVASALALVSSLAVETVPGAVGAGVTVVDRQGGKRTSGATDDRVQQADALQYELDEGPCLAATASRQVVRVDDLTSDPRWPRWSEAVAPLGLRAALSAPLVAGDAGLGAMKVYADEPAAFDDEAERRLAMFSAQAAVLVANVQSYERARQISDELRATVRSRDVVSMAKGVLMGRDGVSEETAFDVLRGRAERAGVTLHDAARTVLGSAARRGR